MTDLQVGAKAPDFNFTTIRGAENGSLSFKNAPFVIYFYPRAGTPACTSEVVDFSRRQADFEKLGVEVIGISPDGPAKLTKFAEKQGIAANLVSDPELDIIKRWGVWVEKSMYGRSFMGVERATFLVNAKGRIAKAWRKVRVAGHADAVLEAATALTASPERA
jgi:peroxiredoxin Q/BCP